MILSLRARQIATVITLVAGSVLALATVHLATLVQIRLEESATRADVLARTLFQQASQVVSTSTTPYVDLRDDPGIRAIVESSIAYIDDVSYAAILDPVGVAIVHSSPELEGAVLRRGVPLARVLDGGTIARLRNLYGYSVFEIDQPLQRGETPFGVIRIGLSPVLIRTELEQSLRPAALTIASLLAIALIVSFVLAKWALQPIRIIQAGLTRLEHGEPGVHVTLPPDPALGDVERSFSAISARLAEVGRAGRPETDQPDDALAMLDSHGNVSFANAEMVTLLGQRTPARDPRGARFPVDHPFWPTARRALERGTSQGPATVTIDSSSPRSAHDPPRRDPDDEGNPRQYQVNAHVIRDGSGTTAGILMTARDTTYLQAVASTLRSSRQLASLGRLLSGVAHEVKNPLNAMTIHLELLKQKLSGLDHASARSEPPPGLILGVPYGGTDPHGDADPGSTGGVEAAPADALRHVAILGDEIRRLDGVIQGFLRFIRPADLHEDNVAVGPLVDEVFALVRPEAERHAITLDNQCSTHTPPVQGDRDLLRQVFLNLAINACHAMPAGGTLRIRTGQTGTTTVWMDVEDTGTGMTSEQMERMFDLYYTTKDGGSGIGLSMVYRIVQLHGGDIDVESAPGHGTRVRVTLPRAGTSDNASVHLLRDRVES